MERGNYVIANSEGCTVGVINTNAPEYKIKTILNLYKKHNLVCNHDVLSCIHLLRAHGFHAEESFVRELVI